MDEPKKYWFKRRRYGMGWIPVTWQGWATLGVYFLVIMTAGIILSYLDKSDGDWTIQTTYYMFFVAFATVALLKFTAAHAPPGKWRWGKSEDDDRDKDW